jgi:hypothetical protein
LGTAPIPHETAENFPRTSGFFPLDIGAQELLAEARAPSRRKKEDEVFKRIRFLVAEDRMRTAFRASGGMMGRLREAR